MTQEEYRAWQKHNLQVLKLGGVISTNFMADGSVEEFREVSGQRVRNEPDLVTDLVKVERSRP